jgi:tRNA(adenine34) deaminase
VSPTATDDWREAMEAALREAAIAGDHGDIPIGAVVVGPDGRIVAADHNRREERGDATAHAEILALRSASENQNSWRLTGHTLVVTLEPCAMCAMAAVWARVDRIVFAVADPKAGAAWSLYNIPQDERLNHRCDLVSGVLADEAADQISRFFQDRREGSA